MKLLNMSKSNDDHWFRRQILRMNKANKKKIVVKTITSDLKEKK